jgi:tRNA(His) 5'-end guanylyltransferase
MIEEDKINDFESRQQYKLLPKIPVVIKIEGRNFEKLTKNYEKPFSEELNNCFSAVLYKLCLEVEGVVFGYQYDDTIILICRNDQTKDTIPWYDNDIQKISSVTASLATCQFYKSIMSSDKGFDIFEDLDIIFTSSVFTVPNIEEAVNVLLVSQLDNLKRSTYNSCYYALLEQEFSKEKVENFLYNTSNEDRIKLLKEKLNIDYYSYPESFRLGQICYRIPKLINDKLKFKWASFKEIPVFLQITEELKKLLSGETIKIC